MSRRGRWLLALIGLLAVVAIVTTAPIGAVLLDRLGVRWLTKQASGSATGTRSGALPDTAGSERFKGA